MKKLTKEKLKYLSELEKSATPADWVPMDLGQALKSPKDIPLLIELRNNAADLINEAKYAQDVEEFYENRYEKLKELCEKNNLSTEFFNIMANGKESSTAIPHHSEIRSLKYEIDKLVNRIKKSNENMEEMERELYLKLGEAENKIDSLSSQLYIYEGIIIDLISNDINKFSFKDIISFKKINNYYEVEYESYYNPHANPKQLKDIKKFDNVPEMVTFMLNFLKERF